MNHAASTLAAGSLTSRLIQALRRSRSLASMLPSLLLTGALTFIITAVMQLLHEQPGAGSFSDWMTTWLTAWPIAFPVAYLIGPSITRFAAHITAPAQMQVPQARRPVGLWFDDIADASSRATVNNGLQARHRLQDPFR